MSSPFSEQMSQSISRISSSLTPTGISGPVVMTPSVTGGEVQTHESSRSFNFARLKNLDIKNPYIAFPMVIVLLTIILASVRSKIWKEEKRPGVLTLFLYVILMMIPVFVWVFLRK